MLYLQSEPPSPGKDLVSCRPEPQPPAVALWEVLQPPEGLQTSQTGMSWMEPWETAAFFSLPFSRAHLSVLGNVDYD